MKHMKKLVSVLLTLVMALALTVPALAAGDTSTLTINTTNGHTYSVYQLLTGDVSGLTNGSGTLSNVEGGANLKSDTTVDAFLTAIIGKTGAELGDTAYSNVEGAAKYTVNGTGSAVGTTVENGYYLVVDSYTGGNVTDGSDTASRYMVAVVGDTTMEPKVSTPGIDKKIIDTDANAAIDGENKKTDTAAIDDTIEYEITGTVPNTEGYTYYYYVVHDTLSEGLTLDQSSFEVTIGTKTLTKYTSGDAANDNYYVYITKNSDGTTTFELALEDLKTLVDTADNGVSVGSAISIKYNATVNDKAEIGKIPNTNTAKLEYSNNPGDSARSDAADKLGTPGTGTATGVGPKKITKTYVTALTILKVDENGMVLTGAEFTLTGDNLTKVIVETNTTFRAAAEGETAEYYKLKNGTYTKTAPISSEGAEGYNADKYEDSTPKYVRVTTVTTSTVATADGTTKKIVGTVNDEGYVIFTGLNAGTYTLSETKTPEGYNTMSDITFTISATQSGSTNVEGGSINWSSNNATIVLDGNNGVFDTTIENLPGTVLPSTGGMGTTLFYVLGSILVLGAGILLVTKKRMSSGK